MEPLVRVGVQQVSDGAAVGIRLRRVGGELVGPSHEAIHRRCASPDRLLLGQPTVENGRN